MHAPRRLAVALLVSVLLAPVIAGADSKLKSRPVDISAYQADLVVLTDADGGTYLVLPQKDHKEIFYGTGKTLYQQIIVGASTNGSAWDVSAYTPRLPPSPTGSIQRHADGTYRRYCYGLQDLPLTLVTGVAAAKILAAVKPVTTAVYYRPYFLARDNRAIYYYVDQRSAEYGGKGYRVFIGKKGAMKQIPVTDVAIDREGSVFATKTGDLRLVNTVAREGVAARTEASLFRGERETKLVALDTYNELPLIHSELGIYDFMGTICDNPSPTPTAP